MSDQHPPSDQSPGSGWSSQGSQNPYGPPSGDEQGRPQEYGAYQQQQSSGGSGLAITALVLGILAILLSWTVLGGFILGLIAIIVGAIGSSNAKKGHATGRGMAIGGIVTGVIGILIAGVITALAAFVFSKADFGSLQECVNQAQNQSEIDQCEREFQRDFEDQLNNG